MTTWAPCYAAFLQPKDLAKLTEAVYVSMCANNFVKYFVNFLGRWNNTCAVLWRSWSTHRSQLGGFHSRSCSWRGDAGWCGLGFWRERERERERESCLMCWSLFPHIEDNKRLQRVSEMTRWKYLWRYLVPQSDQLIYMVKLGRINRNEARIHRFQDRSG